METSYKSFSWKFINLYRYKFQTPLHNRIHQLVIRSMFSRLQKVSKQIEMVNPKDGVQPIIALKLN
jgi:hypothetical protein